MSKINLEEIQIRYNTALLQKKDNIEIVKKSIIDNELIEKFESIQKSKKKIDSIELLEKHQKEIKKFFGEVYEIITAPGVNRFVEWLESLDTNGLDGNLRNNISKTLLDGYSTFGEDIKSVVDNHISIEPGNTLFENIKKAVKINITKRIPSLGTKKDEIIENIPEFIEELNELLNELSEIEELGFKDVKDFYTINLDEKGNEDYKPEIDKKADYHYGLIKQIVESKDFLTTNQDNIELSTIIEHINNNVKDIKDSIAKLKTIDIQNEDDSNISIIYNKFEKNLVFDTQKNNISGYLEKEISGTWEKTITAYNVCQDFYNNNLEAKILKLEGNKDKWLDFKFTSKIEQYILTLKNIIKDNPIGSLNNNDISKINTSYAKIKIKIEGIEDNNPKNGVVNFFTAISSDYKEKNIAILIKLNTDDSDIKKIKNSITEINNFIENINKSESLLDALNDDFVDGILCSYSYIKTEFTSAIENSKIKDDYQYFKELNEKGILVTKEILEDESEVKRLKNLLDYNLININLTKNI